MTHVASETASRLHLRGAVQGIGFRPFVSKLARTHGLNGWVLNTDAGIEIHVEGAAPAVAAFEHVLRSAAPRAAQITDVEAGLTPPVGCVGFEIRPSVTSERPTVHAPVDVATCDACVAELLSPDNRHHLYPYVSCSACGPRYSILRSLPYDRSGTTMSEWPLCTDCTRDYRDPSDRRFHAQAVACPRCGPSYHLVREGIEVEPSVMAFAAAARLLASGHILGVKGIGGYHLACDAYNADAVTELRRRKHRDEKPFAVMARDLATARTVLDLTRKEEELLESAARPIVIARATKVLAGIAPGRDDLGVMLPYAPAHHVLFELGAPSLLVMTSGNRSDEPIAYLDEDAAERLNGIADALLVGERPIARPVDDSVVRSGAVGSIMLRRSRGYAPGLVARVPCQGPVLAVGGDLKSTVTLVVGGRAFMSQHLGDLHHVRARAAFDQSVADLLATYTVEPDDPGLLVAHDLHPEYVSTDVAVSLGGTRSRPVQHHRAHVASVLAERHAYDTLVIGVALDGTGWGDDGAIWGGELFAGTVVGQLTRVGHLRSAALPGGDAAARHPVQAAAGFLVELDPAFDFRAPPFGFPARYRDARALVESGVRTWQTTSVGRLLDAAAALAGFTRPIAYEGQAAMWLEQLARAAPRQDAPAMPFHDGELDFRDVLAQVIDWRLAGVDSTCIARRFHRSLALGIADAAEQLCEEHGTRIVVISGGVFQNALLVQDLSGLLAELRIELWANRRVPPNDGGLSLGQAALGAVAV